MDNQTSNRPTNANKDTEERPAVSDRTLDKLLQALATLCINLYAPEENFGLFQDFWPLLAYDTEREIWTVQLEPVTYDKELNQTTRPELAGSIDRFLQDLVSVGKEMGDISISPGERFIIFKHPFDLLNLIRTFMDEKEISSYDFVDQKMSPVVLRDTNEGEEDESDEDEFVSLTETVANPLEVFYWLSQQGASIRSDADAEEDIVTNLPGRAYINQHDINVMAAKMTLVFNEGAAQPLNLESIKTALYEDEERPDMPINAEYNVYYRLH